MKFLFNDNWEFLETPYGTSNEALAEADRFLPVPLPHDWLIRDVRHLYRNSTGWYRKRFRLAEPLKTVRITFDGVYMDSTVYVNGVRAGACPNGSLSFTLDLTGLVHEGENELLVRVNYRSPNSRWYTGAGIYRNVWLCIGDEPYPDADDIYVSTRRCRREDPSEYYLLVETPGLSHAKIRLYDPDGSECRLEPAEENTFLVRNVREWSPEQPYLYRLEVPRFAPLRIGFRTIEMNSHGLFLNGQRYKLHGVCLHYDLGALGGAFHKSAARRQMTLMKKMGVNALRGAHAVPAPEWMDLADEMGFLVISEAFDTWERPKTEYDYARFFPAHHEEDVRRWVRRDRNHPSLFLWSIGNEIYDTHADPERGAQLVQELSRLVRSFDPRGNGAVTFASNWLAWENTRRCADLLKIVGYNYGEKYYEAHHEEYPDWVIYGSETSSIVQSRGIYHFPLSSSKLDDDDGQCSALGNSPTSWGAQSLEACVCVDRDLAWSMGQFLWSGIDYLGEPTPYHTKNSYFGQADTACFPKDSYYVWQAAWTDPAERPVLHIFPYWDHNPGQLIDVRAASNAAEVELFLNGKSCGRQRLNRDPGSGSHILADYRIPFEEGELLALGYDEAGKCIARESRHSFGNSKRILLEPERTRIPCGTGEILFLVIRTEDQDGYPVDNACDRVLVTVTGAGKLIGLDNGDSTDFDTYQGTSRRLFSGRLLAIIAADEPGKIRVLVSAPGLESAEEVYEAYPPAASGVPGGEEASEAGTLSAAPFPGERAFWHIANEDKQDWTGNLGEIPVRAVRILPEECSENRLFSACQRELSARARVLPENADDQEVVFSAVNDQGAPSHLVKLSQEGSRVRMQALGDGSFRLRCTSKSGTDRIRVISELEYEIRGIGTAFRDPYGFISGCDYTASEGAVTPGNERGAATARDGVSSVTYEEIDFGKGGSDRITVPIFALTSEPYPIEIWEGQPEAEGARLLSEVVYQRKSIWNTYQEETWQLPARLRGITSISFRVHQKIHIKGFSFERQERCRQRLTAGEADTVYGDSYVKGGSDILGIGNNVTLEYDEMRLDEFFERGAGQELPARENSERELQIDIEGRTMLDVNTIQLCLSGESGEMRALLDFERAGDWTRRTFCVTVPAGVSKVSFLFLPGSNFDFRAFCFHF